MASALVGYLLVRAFFVPLDLIRTGAELMRERDFTSHFREVGQPEMDALVRIYNRMIDRLREERLKLEERNLFVDKVLEASPTGIVTLDIDGQDRAAQPRRGAVGSTARRPSCSARASSGSRTPIGRRAGRARRWRLGSGVVPRQPAAALSPRRRSSTVASRVRFFLIEELTDELRASERAAYGKLIRMMSHEVNNSVGAVRLAARILSAPTAPSSGRRTAGTTTGRSRSRRSACCISARS